MTRMPGFSSISRILAGIRSLWRGLRRRTQVEAEMREEFRHHIDLRTEALLREGLSPAEARRRARIEFGSMATHRAAGRVARGLRSFDRIRFSWLDFKLGLRMLARYPGLTVVGGLAMAFGIAAGTAGFELMRDMAMPVLPGAEGRTLVRIHNVDTRTTRADAGSLHDFAVWREELRSVEDIGAFRLLRRNLAIGKGPADPGAAAPVEAAAISASAFEVLPVLSLLGRPLLPADEAPGAPAVAVIGYELWRGRFASDPGVVGRVVRFGGEPMTVVGVMPEGFGFPVTQELWVPLRLDPTSFAPGAGPGIVVFGRLAPGATLEDAQAELAVLGARTAGEWPETHGHLRPVVEKYIDPVDGEEALAAVIFTLNALFLVALMVVFCASVALLLFARAATREGEMAVRSALGASRGRIVSQLFAEALALAGVAAVLGLAGGSLGLKWVVRVLDSLQPQGMPFWVGDELSPMTTGFAAALALLGAGVAGVLPGLKVTGRGAPASLQQLAGRGSGIRLGRLWPRIIVAQVALGATLVPIAFAFGLQTWQSRANVIGLPADDFLSVRLEMDGDATAGEPGEAYSEILASAPTGDSGVAFQARFEDAYRELERRLSAEPGVTGVTFASELPGPWHDERPVEVDGVDGLVAPAPTAWQNRVQVAAVDPDFFEVMSATLSSGRGFVASDVDVGRRVVVVNEAFVRERLGGRNAVGRRLRYWRRTGSGSSGTRATEAGPWYEIVGVVRGLAMTVNPMKTSHAGIYHPLLPGEAYPVHMAVRVVDEPEAFTARLRRVATDAAPALRLHQPLPLDETARRALVPYDTWFRVILLASVVTLLLANAGIYATLSFTVSRRTREIGVRIALGADRRRIVGAILARMVRHVALGVLIGAGLGVLFVIALSEGLWLPMSLRGLALVLTYMAVMLGMCMLACIVPTRRALRIEPMQALSADG